ncbi:MAG TPA: hypothetical protein VKH42_08970 [Vicinamibacterales bacterium]|nr:hypothetical protein [Vicinamibacterales bacterium]
MLSPLILASALASQAAVPATINVSKVHVGPAVAVADLDLGKLKGELRQLGWAPNALEVYVETAESDPPSEKLHHFVVSVLGGAVQPVDTRPDWAEAYWSYKSDRRAPGYDSIEIDVRFEQTTQKVGTGSARPGTQAMTGPAAGPAFTEDASMAGEGQKLPVVRFVLFGETVSEFKNERPIPGLLFSWGPRGTGAIAFIDTDGRLTLLDKEKHTQRVPNAKDATLPAWTADGAHLAWLHKTAKKKYTLMVAPVGE